MARPNAWKEKELLLALHLYCCLPFGQLHQRNPQVVAVARQIGRSPSAVAMKACNFASLDPSIEQKGLGNASEADRTLWNAFIENSEKVAIQAEAAFFEIERVEQNEGKKPSGPTETLREVKVRRVQRFFRQSVLVSYGNRCALSGIGIPELVIASHIIPWAESEERRADPTNGIALNPLFDTAFDRGLMTFDEHHRVVLSMDLKDESLMTSHGLSLLNIEGRALNLPARFRPDPAALDWHRSNRFKN